MKSMRFLFYSLLILLTFIPIVIIGFFFTLKAFTKGALPKEETPTRIQNPATLSANSNKYSKQQNQKSLTF